MPPQITRLVLLTILIVAAYLIARSLLTPSSFGQYGWFRGDALAEIAQREPQYAGRTACDECHGDQVKKLAQAEHKSIACETCHGVGKAHAENPDAALPKLTDHLCLRCHEQAVSRPAWLKQISYDKHYKGQHCQECHVPHQPTDVP